MNGHKETKNSQKLFVAFALFCGYFPTPASSLWDWGIALMPPEGRTSVRMVLVRYDRR